MAAADVNVEVDDVRQVVVMGVSGVGKTSVASRLADRLGWDFAEGDDLHTDANLRKMAAGRPLTDADRMPWLEAVAAWMADRIGSGRSAVVTCSALRRSYRDVLRRAGPGVLFCHLVASEAELGHRLAARRGHFMPASLLASQVATLEPLQPDEWGVTVPSDGPPDDIATRALLELGLHPR